VNVSESPSAPLRHHHRRLTEAMEKLLAAVAVARPSAGPPGPELPRALAALERVLLPHAEAEDCFLYPEVARLRADLQLTAAMGADHAFIARCLRELRAGLASADREDRGLTAEGLAQLSAVAGRLAGRLRAHFEKEEGLLFPLIEARMSPEDIRRRIVDPINAMSGTAPAPPPETGPR